MNTRTCNNMFRIKRFCCCCSLRTGSLIIGYLGLVANVLQIIGTSVHVALLNRRYWNENNVFNDYPLHYYYTRNYIDSQIPYVSVAITYHVISTFFHVSLIWGINKNRREFILPWIILKALECCIVLIVCLLVTGLYVAYSYRPVTTLFLLIAIFTALMWLMAYTFVCVFSYYSELKVRVNNENTIPPPWSITYQEEKKENL